MNFTISYTDYERAGITEGLRARGEFDAMAFFKKHPGPSYTLYCGAWIIGASCYKGDIDIVVDPAEPYPLYEKACELNRVINEAEKLWGRVADNLILMAKDANVDGSHDCLLLKWRYDA